MPLRRSKRSCIFNEGYFCHNRLNQLASMLNNTADQLHNLLTSLVPVKVSIMAFAIGTFSGFHQLFGFNSHLEPFIGFHQHSSTADLVAALLSNSIQVDGFIVKSCCGKLHYVLLDLGIREIHFGSRFVRDIDSTTGRPPRKFARSKTTTKKVDYPISVFIQRLISFGGSVVREQNHL